METTEYLRPGSYIGQLIRPSAGTVTGFPRLPVFIAKGSRLARAKNSEIVRAKVYDEDLTFIGVGPYTALLNHTADGDKAHTELLEDGARVPDNEYTFSTTTVANDTIQIPSQHYNATATYVVTYQSIDLDVLDPLPFDNLRSIERVGRSVDGTEFLEATDFFVPVTVGAPAATASNTLDVSSEYGSVNGALSKATIDGPGAEDIVLTFTDRYKVIVSVVNGGAESFVEDVPTRTVTLTFITTVSTQTSLTATIAAALAGLTLVGSAVGGAGVVAWTTGSQAQTKLGSTFDYAGTGDGDVALNQTTAYTHPYARDYTIICTTGGDSATAAFAWYSTPNSLGNTAAVHNPHPDLVTLAAHRNAIAAPGDNVAVALEYGLVVVFHDQAGTFDVNDTWTFRAYGAGLIEADLRHTNTNQFTSISAVTDVGVPTGDGIVTVSSTGADYTGVYNRTYKVWVTAIGGGPVATLKWAAVGDDGVTTGTTASLANDGTALLELGVTIAVNMDAGNFAVNDRYTFTISAPRVVPSIKDDRTYTAEVDVPLTGNVSFVYFTDTPEGGIGTFAATTADPHIELPGNLTMHVRNLVGPRYAASETFTWSITLDDFIDWSLLTEVVESIDEEDIIHDVLGRVTGTPDTYYVVLRHAPTTLMTAVNSVPAALGTATIITSGGENTRFLNLGATSPADNLTITYRYKGREPDAGDTYRFTALYLRDTDLYNVPTLVMDEAAGVAFCEPKTIDNHLAIVNEIAWDFSPVGIYLCQVADADDDGIFQDSDYDTAIEATEGTSAITDMVVLDAWGTIPQQLETTDKLANPLLNAQRLNWFGAPLDTPIGDVNTVGSLIYTSKVTFAVYGDNPAHGTRILVAPTSCQRSMVFEDKTTAQIVDLDGSFVAAAFCLQYASFRNPSQTALNLNLTVFKTVETHTESEVKQLGGAQIVYVDDVGSGVYRWGEEVTTDPTGTINAPEEFKQINAMTQKRYMNRRIKAAIDAAFIGLVPDSPEAAVAILSNIIKSTVEQDVTNGMIGEYLNDNGAIRKMNPATDIIAYRDRTMRTLYRFFVGYFLKYTARYVFGLAITDSSAAAAVGSPGSLAA